MSETSLSELLSEFARTLITDFPIQAILDHLVLRIVEVLPITSAGVTLISAGSAPHYVAASDPSALRFERLQSTLGQGPCTVAYETGDAVAVADFTAEHRFPTFAEQALSAGLGAAFAFPLRHGPEQLGALDLYRNTPGPLSDTDLATAQTLADVTAAYVLNAQARESARETSDRFRSDSLHDPLTGLPNRLLLQQRLEHAAHRAERSHTPAAVLFADLDRFKDINDMHGHQVGDELLIAVARRLSGLVRTGDTLARISGDEFVFLCEDLTDATDIHALAERIRDALATPFDVTGRSLAVTASVGMAYAGPGEVISHQLVIDADHAMYRAKSDGRAALGIVDIRPTGHPVVPSSLERDLGLAFTRDELTLVYQPIVRTADGHLSGVEALLRWRHRTRGNIQALDVIRIAEGNGLIVALGAWVLNQSCSARSRWLHEHPHQPLDLAVNVSTRQLLSPNFVATVKDALTLSEMDPHALVLELSESILIPDTPRALDVLAELTALGVRLALDDFGTGFSSLSYLRQFTVDILKIDRSFITGLTRDAACDAVVTAIAQLASQLGLQVIAEGVETEDQLTRILALGIDAAQGFLYAPGIPAEQIDALLRDERPWSVLPHAPQARRRTAWTDPAA